MRLIVSLALLLVLSNFHSGFAAAITKGLEPFPETNQDCSSGETTHTPEATNVRSKNPEADPVNDVDLPQLPSDRSESSTITPKAKRCARSRFTVGSPRSANNTLSLKRRDADSKMKKKKCKMCLSRLVCKFHPCDCKKVCKGFENEIAKHQQYSPETYEDTNEEEAQSKMEKVSARFGESSEEDAASRSRYYTLGSVQPGPLMHLFAKAFNIQSEENFEKLIILGKVKGPRHLENLDKLVILDLLHIFDDDEKSTAIVHQTNINPAKIQELDGRLEEAIAKKKQELNSDQLSTEQIRDVVNQVLEEMNQNNRPGMTDPAVQLPETETKCSVDEAVDDILDVMSDSNEQRAQTDTKHKEEEPQNQIKNPPVIQGNFVGKHLEDGWVDDNEEARPSLMVTDTVPTYKPFMKDPKKIKISNDISLVNTVIGDAPREAEVINLSEDVKPAPESDNQVNNPVDDVQEKINIDSNDVNSYVKAQAGDSINEEPISTAESARKELEDNIFKIVEDSLKTASADRYISLEEKNKTQEPQDGQRTSDSNLNDGPIIFEEETKPIFIEDNNEKQPSQANADNAIRVIEIPKIPAESTDFESKNKLNEPTRPDMVEPLSSLEDNDVSFESRESEESNPVLVNTPTAIQNPEAPDMVERMPEFESRDQFSDESISQEKLSNFGSLVPTNERVDDSRMKKLYFVGKDIKLPLQMVQDKNGVMRLTVDMDTLCNCKNANCTRKHADRKKPDGEISKNNFPADESTVLPDLNVRFGRDSSRNQELMDSFMDTLNSHMENSEVFKRSPNLNSENDNPITAQDKTHDNDGLFISESTAEKLENDIKKLNENIGKYNEENSQFLNKGNVALFKDVEKTKDISRMITLADNVLSWMKDLAMKNLNS